MPYLAVDTGELYYEEAGQGPPLLLLHGFTDSGQDLTPLRDAFRRHYRVLLPDLPGQGRSRPLPRPYGVDFYQQDAAAVAQLVDALGLARFHLGGFSDGAEVALLLAIFRPAQVISLVAWGVAGALEPGALPEVAEVAGLLDHAPPHFVDWRARLLARYGAAPARAMTQGWAGAIRRIIAAGGDISLSRADQIRCPTLLINGADDRVNPPAVVQRLAARIPHAELIVVPNVGHPVHQARERWFIRTVRRWLARHAAG